MPTPQFALKDTLNKSIQDLSEGEKQKAWFLFFSQKQRPSDVTIQGCRLKNLALKDAAFGDASVRRLGKLFNQSFPKLQLVTQEKARMR